MSSQAQIAINTVDVPADTCALLDISSNDKGVLIPRMTAIQREGINTPANGLIIYQSDSLKGFYYFQDSSWIGLKRPCGESLFYGNQTYHTVAVGVQCWMKENLNIGINSITQTNNGIIEKKCYKPENDTLCAFDGSLYSWDEMMNWTTSPGGQGICPNGFHVPTDTEYMVLESNADSKYPLGMIYGFMNVWENDGLRGEDCGHNLAIKSNGIYYEGVGRDIFGFSARGLSSGPQYGGGTEAHAIYYWTSTLAVLREIKLNMDGTEGGIYRFGWVRGAMFHVRCLKN